MQIAIHNPNKEIVDYLNNDVPFGLHYDSDSFEKALDTGIASLNIRVIKRDIYGRFQTERLRNITDSAYVSFKLMGESYLMNILRLTETEEYIELDLEDSFLELLGENRLEYKNEGGRTFEEYMAAMEILEYTRIKIGTNEIYDRVLPVDYGEETVLKRIQSLVSTFGAEAEYITHLYPNGELNYVQMNLYKSRSASDIEVGVGSLRDDVTLYYGRDISGVHVVSDKSDLFTALRVQQKNGEYFKPKKNIEVKASDGIHIEMYMNRNNTMAYAPMASLLYPSTLNLDDCDPWVVRTIKVDTDDYDTILTLVQNTLLRNCYPIKTYTIENQAGQVIMDYNLKVGDVIYNSDKDFADGLLVRARISKIKISLSNPYDASLEFTSAMEVRRVYNDRLSRIRAEMLEEAQPYNLQVSSSGALTFKSSSDEVTITSSLTKGDTVVDASYIYYLNDIVVGTTNSCLISASALTNNTGLLRVVAFVNGKEVANQLLTLATVYDGLSPIIMKIESSNGTLFAGTAVSTVLTARLFKDNEEIDLDGSSFRYVWTKVKQSGVLDTEWNTAHQESSKSVSITPTDVYKKSVFSCSIERV